MSKLQCNVASLQIDTNTLEYKLSSEYAIIGEWSLPSNQISLFNILFHLSLDPMKCVK